MINRERFTITVDASDEIETRLAQFERDRAAGPVDLGDYADAADDESFGAMVTELARIDLEYGMNAGDEPDASRYIEEYPDVFIDQYFRTQLAFEEYRLRRRCGQKVTVEDIATRYQVDCSEWQHVEPEDLCSDSPGHSWTNKRSAFPRVHYPNVNETIAGYQLIRRLGEGSFSRVFLARQPDLVSRLVVLKVTPFSTEESDQLAQLQHTNIIPIYSIHRERELSCICMPFLGSTTLAELSLNSGRWTSLDGPAHEMVSTIASRSHVTVRDLGGANRQGNLLSTTSESLNGDVNQFKDDVAVSAEFNGRRQDVLGLSELSQLGYIGAFLSLIVGAVDGLAHAHERGIIHRDLKPANILVTDDGRALLLDFNLAVSNTQTKTRLVGGTLPYMSPQQLNAIETSAPADPRDDVFSMGVILYELLSGKLPFHSPKFGESPAIAMLSADRRRSPVSLRSINKRIPADVESIVFHCLSADREDRYQNAGELREDLDCHRQNLPLRYAPNGSFKEQVAKWITRHPRITSASTVGSVAALVLLMSSVSIWKRSDRILRLGVQSQWQQFESSVPEIVLLLSTPGREPEILQVGMDQSSRWMNQWNVDAAPWKPSAEFKLLEESSRHSLARELSKLAYIMAAAEADIAIQASAAQHDQHGTTALMWNQRAVELDPSLESLAEYQRHRITTRLSGADNPSLLTLKASTAPSFELQSTLAADSGDMSALLEISSTQLQSHPTNLIAWFNLATAHWRTGDLDDAVASFNVCDRLRPNWFVTIFNRGLCHLERGRARDAAEDFSVCLNLQPRSLTARFNRAVALRQSGDLASSLDDLASVITSGNATTRMVLYRSQVFDSLGQREQATADRRAALLIEPQDASDWGARGVSRLADSPVSALQDFAAALRIDPNDFSSLQNSAHVLSERLNRPNDAIEILSRLVTLRPNDASPVAARGILHARLGSIDEAIRDANEAEARSPSGLEQLQIAGIYAMISGRSSDPAALTKVEARKKSMHWLACAIRTNPELARVAASDNDLASLRGDDQFQRLIGSGTLIDSASR